MRICLTPLLSLLKNSIATPGPGSIASLTSSISTPGSPAEKRTAPDPGPVGPKTAKPAMAANAAYPPDHYDLVVVGAGIVGLATAREMSARYPDLRIAVVEKEAEVAAHQSGHNSGVIHVGVYYTPGTLKAKLCVKGAAMTYAFCDAHDIPYKRCGKLIVAVEPHELPLLDNLLERGKKNGVPGLTMVEGRDIPKIEPHCRGLRAIHSPNTGIVDWKRVTQAYGHDFERSGGRVILNFPVTGFELSGESAPPTTPKAAHFPVKVVCGSGKSSTDLKARYVITCAGLYSDKVAELSGCSSVPKIIPFRGEYLLLAPEKRYLIRGNIYPVPDPKLPFLGVHFTPRMNGDVWLGPNAVLAFRREGYSFSNFDAAEMWDTLKFSGFRKLSLKYLAPGLREMYESFSLKAKMAALQRYVPEVSVADVRPGPSGVRAQALDAAGNLVDDFVFDSGLGPLAERTLHVRNAPSPAATSSLAIGEMVADKAAQKFGLAPHPPLSK